MDEISDDWLRRLANGDPVAAAEFFQRYGEPMQRLALRNMGPKLRQRLDPEDIVQSACRSFFRGMEGGQFDFDEESDLWRLLCAITLNKTRNQSRFHGRQRRDTSRQEVLNEQVTGATGPEEDPALIVAWQDSVEEYLAALTDEQQQVIGMLLEGHTQVEIAKRMGCAERTVRRIVSAIRERLKADSHFQ